ncbi:unnamed protein product [Rotaria sordida]|uniref:Uncharacterized protein n=1 Tax=Rotaria sordida TaxID=392033 RepID=A0A818ZHP2_9BILA|nr:unnamed protein product [Rotaria sordida]
MSLTPSDYDKAERKSSFRNFNSDDRCQYCNKFKSERYDEEICECNQNKGFHLSPNTKLEEDKEKTPIPIIKVRGIECGKLENGALYAHFSMNTSVRIIAEFIIQEWNIPKPKLIMSIIGGAKNFTLTDQFESNIINGIIKVALKSNVWMITNGYKVGIVQLIGQEINRIKLSKFNKNTIIAIGIGNWGSIKNVEILTDMQTEEKNKKKKRIPKILDSENEEEDELQSGECYLEMNHSHYLMLDDGTYRCFDTKDYRTCLSSLVTIVVEGGEDTIRNMYSDLKNKVPIVIIKGSGRVADFMSRWLLSTKDFNDDSDEDKVIYEIDELCTRYAPIEVFNNRAQTKSKIRTDICAELHVDSSSKKLHQLFNNYKKNLEKELKNVLSGDSEMNKEKREKSESKKNDFNGELLVLLDKVMYCLQPGLRPLINIFDLNSETDLSETIFEAIYKSFSNLPRNIQEKLTKQTLLDLAIDWNCIDTAKEFIFQGSLKHIPKSEEVFINALTKNSPLFVYEFLKLGFDPADIFFPKNQFTDEENRYKDFFKILYTHDLVMRDETHLKNFIDSDKSTNDKSINNVKSLNRVLYGLIGDYMYKLYFDTEQAEYNDRIKWGLIKNSIKFEQNKNNKSLSNEVKKEKAHKYIMRDLFLWAILMNYIDMAKIFLCYMKYRICPALIATKILKQYHSKANYGDLKDRYMENAKYFEKYAIDCLSKCDEYDERRACDIAIQQNELYGYVTCLQIAADADDKLFISTSCCSQAMHNIWYDKLHPKKTLANYGFFLILGILSCGLLSPTCIDYREEEKDVVAGESLKPIVEPFGIDYIDPYPLEYPRYFKQKLVFNKYIHQLQHFHLSLVTKYIYHVISYIFFLLLFSYVLLFEFSPPSNKIPSIHWTEILTIILVSCMLIEEIHYFFTQDSITISGKIKSYCRDLFKPLTMIAFILFYIGLILRFVHANSKEDFVAARIVMAFDIELWWLRCLSFIIVIPFLGPHLVAIGKMLQDLLFFLCIIAIVMIAYGVASRSIVYYPVENGFTTETNGFIDISFDGRAVFRQIIYPVYYLLYSQFGNETQNLDSNVNAGWSITTQVLLAAHMLFVNMLLFNLLIAMLNKRFEKVYEDARNIWHTQQYLYTREYFTRSPFLPPINLFYDIYYLIRMFVFFIRRKFFYKPSDPEAPVFKMIAKNQSLLDDWREYEGASTYEYAHAEVKALKPTSTKSSNDLIDTMDSVKEIQETVKKLNSVMEGKKLGSTN